jgi:hypothetical protein
VNDVIFNVELLEELTVAFAALANWNKANSITNAQTVATTLLFPNTFIVNNLFFFFTYAESNDSMKAQDILSSLI